MHARALALGFVAALMAPVAATAADWRKGADGYETALFDQKQTGEPMLVYFATPWCGYCKVLEAKVFETSKIREFLGGFPKVKINPEDSPDAEMLARKFGVSGYPSVFVVPPGNKFPEKIRASGAAGPDAFIAEIKRVTGGKVPAPASGGGKKPVAAEAPQESLKVNIPATLLKDLPADVVQQQAEGRHAAVVQSLSSEIKRAEKNGIRPKMRVPSRCARSGSTPRRRQTSRSTSKRSRTTSPRGRRWRARISTSRCSRTRRSSSKRS
jgi:thiol-disulfide isomerase/thioredoxin